MRLGLIIVVVASLGTMQAHAGALLDKQDRFTGKRMVAWNSAPDRSDQFAFSTFAFYPPDSSSPESYSLQLMTYSDRGRYLSCHQSAWLIDGQRAPELEGSYRSSSDTLVFEYWNAIVPRQILERLASAKTVEFKVCGTESAVSQDDLEGTRKVLDATR